MQPYMAETIRGSLRFVFVVEHYLRTIIYKKYLVFIIRFRANLCALKIR